jgi:hypothetical protein
MEDLKKENEQLKKQVDALREQLHALYRERDENSDENLVTDYQSETDEQISD